MINQGEKNKSFYDKLYNDNSENQSYEVRSKTDAFIFMINRYNIALQQKKVFDFGFGSGNLLIECVKRKADCFGVEISETAVARLRGRGVNVQQLSSDILPYQDGYFDVVVASHAIEHVSDERAVLSEISRVIKKGGFFIMGVPTMIADLNPLHFRVYSKNDVDRLANILGVELVGCKEFGGRFFRFFLSITKIFSSSIEKKREISQQIVKKYSFIRFLREIYHYFVVPVLLLLYKLDAILGSKSGKEIWFIFKK